MGDQAPLGLGDFSFALGVERHLHTAWRELGPTLEEVINLSALPLYGDMDAVSVVFGEEDEKKLK